MKTNFKIGWVTPTTHNTSITGFSSSIVPNLRDVADVDFITFDDHYCNLFDNISNKKLFFEKISDDELDIYDYIIYNFGNNWENHGKIINMSSYRPGVIILHDASMHHVVAYYTSEKLKDRSFYANFLISEYGQYGADIVSDSEIYTASPKYGPWDSKVGPDFGFLDFFTEGCNGIVAHSNYTVGKLKKLHCPVHSSRLPGDEKGTWNSAEIELWKKLFLTKKEFIFCVMGYVNEQKNMHMAIEYISLLQSNGVKCKLLVLGGDKSGYHKKIAHHAKTRGLENSVQFSLNLTKPQFDTAKKDVDIYLSFRFPNYEGCSAAAFEAMQTGRPLITLNSGAFGDLDKNAVFFIEDSNRMAEHAKKMSKYLAVDRKKLIDVGELGRSYSLGFDSKMYAEELFNFLSKVNKTSKSRLTFSRYSLHQSDLFLHGPNYIFFDENSILNSVLSKCLEPYISLAESPYSIKMLIELFENDPMKYWDVVGLFKKLKADIGSPIFIDPHKLDIDFMYNIFFLVSETKNENLLRKLCFILKINYNDYATALKDKKIINLNLLNDLIYL